MRWIIWKTSVDQGAGRSEWLIGWLIDDFQVEIDKAGVLRQFVEHGIEYVAEPNIIVGHEEGKTNTKEINNASVILHIILVLYLYIIYNV